MEVQVAQRAVELARRNDVVQLQATMESLPEGGVMFGDKLILPIGAEFCECRHHFAPDTYGRELLMPAGVTIVGKIHRHAHVNVVSMGRVRVYTEHEGEVEITAPCTFVSVPGTKRAVHILEDCVWTTIHANPSNTTDLAQLEREIIMPDFTEDQV